MASFKLAQLHGERERTIQNVLKILTVFIYGLKFLNGFQIFVFRIKRFL